MGLYRLVDRSDLPVLTEPLLEQLAEDGYGSLYGAV
jgi:hypothetical protein